MAEQDKNKAAKKAASSQKAGATADEATKVRDNATAPGVTAPEPKDTANQSPTTEAPGVAPAEQVQEQRSEEQQAALDAAKAEEGTDANGPATPAEKGQQTRAASDVREAAAADAEARAADSGDGESTAGVTNPLAPNYEGSDDPVQVQRREEAEARTAKAAEATADLSEEDQRLLGAAPGGQRTAMTGGREGSTKVTHTAAQSRPPLSGPLDAPVTNVENYAATEDDPDNRVYADEAGPRDVHEDTEATKARYVDEDGNAVTGDEMFDDDGTKTFVTTKMRVYEVFTFPNTKVEGRRLAYAAGRRVPRGEAENVKAQISVNSQFV